MCPDGQVSNSNGSACEPCPFGQYRVGSAQLTCQDCNDPVSYALSASSSICVQCTINCPVNYYWNNCPRANTPGYYDCSPCPPVPLNAHIVTGLTNQQCLVQCDTGFWYNIDTHVCTGCNMSACSPGFVYSACTAYQDSNCETACINSTMPSSNAHYAQGCEWACLPGYSLKTTKFFHTVEYTCL